MAPPSISPEPNVEGVRNVSEGGVIISADPGVLCCGERVSRVDRVVVDPDEERATHPVVRRGLLAADERLAPVDRVRALEDLSVDLDCQADVLERFTRY